MENISMKLCLLMFVTYEYSVYYSRDTHQELEPKEHNKLGKNSISQIKKFSSKYSLNKGIAFL